MPVFAPVLLLGSEIGPVWLGVLLAMMPRNSFLTPPFGPALFYRRRESSDGPRTVDIDRGVAPFVALRIIAIAIVWTWPELAEGLPDIIFDS